MRLCLWGVQQGAGYLTDVLRQKALKWARRLELIIIFIVFVIFIVVIIIIQLCLGTWYIPDGKVSQQNFIKCLVSFD